MSNKNKIFLESDPRYWGPGVWNAIHTMAINAKTIEEKKNFSKMMVIFSKSIPCENCRTHFKSYLESHPVEAFFDFADTNNNNVGIFVWSWKFHNEANKHAKHPEVLYEDAYEYYSTLEKSGCSVYGGCHGPPKTKYSVDENTSKEKINKIYRETSGIDRNRVKKISLRKI